jgi:endonuclease G
MLPGVKSSPKPSLSIVQIPSSDRLFLTNNHVIPDIQEGKHYLVEFNYEMSVNRQPKPISRFNLRPDEFFVTNDEDDLDFTIIAVGESVNGQN